MNNVYKEIVKNTLRLNCGDKPLMSEIPEKIWRDYKEMMS